MAEMAKLRDELEDSRIQMANSGLEQNMAEIKRSQAELAMAQAEFSRSMVDMDYSQAKEMKEEKMGLSLRFVYLLFPSLSSSFFNGCIFPFYELISFSRVLDVV